MDAAKSLPPTFDTVIKTDQGLPNGRQSNATEPGDDIVAFGATSIGEIEKLMEELRTARDYLRSEGERVRRINARYAHLTRTASASVKIIAESMGKWRPTEREAPREADAGMSRSHVSPLSSFHDVKLQHELTDTQARN
jgi:hypothetical protein